jgi:hypothetical protein
MEKVTIKVLANPDNPQLGLKYVGARDYIPTSAGPDGKTITGLDENALEIIRIADPKERKKVQDSIKKKREELERLLGRDLDVTSNFWDDFYVIVEDGIILDPTNPMHQLIETFLIANKKVAPSEDAIADDDEFANCVFYFHRETEEITKTAKKAMDKDAAVAKLFTIAETNPSKLINIYSYLFGYDAKNEVLPMTAYVKIKELLDVTDERELSKNIKKVLDVLKLKPEELNTKLVLDKAVKKRIITTKGNIYRRGDIILGNNYDEALDYLMSPENSAEVVSLKKEVDLL